MSRAHGGGPGGLDLLADVRRLLRESHPWQFLCFVSGLLAVVDPRRTSPFERATGPAPQGPDLGQLAGTFLDVRRVETTALLAAMAELTSDEVLATRIRRELAAREDPLPWWLTQLAPITVDRCLEMIHVLGDGDNLALAVRTAAGDELTAVVYIDHNLGTLVKDAFVVGESLDEVSRSMFAAAAADPDISLRTLDLADARARIAEAIESGAITFPPCETDTWPASRPFVEWVIRQLPEGGTGHLRPEWSDAERDRLTKRFFASPLGLTLDREGRDLFESILWFACDYGPGDPLRWSPVAVEILLTDWLPRKVVADAEFLTHAPEVLRRFIRFSHVERGIRETLTATTLEAVDRWEPEYQAIIRTARPQGPEALLVAMGLLEGESGMYGGVMETLPSYRDLMLLSLRDAVGGDEVLRHLQANALPDEALDWSTIPEDIHRRVGEVAMLTDRCCEQLLDAECRTACRRLLADVAAADPEIFRRRGRSDTAAAAVTWIVVKANDLFRSHTGGLTAKQLAGWFGLTGNPSQRAKTMLKAVGAGDDLAYDTLRLGTTRYLVAARRGAIIDLRDRYEAMDD